ncbi:Blue-light-activated protein [Pseudomonas syringae pv. actinidiae]|uniref:PAS domain-containing hybrid sensor histidine kinase/response regulator n=1 Tax=Pseudomonas syringae TaxID=317 RepID=UPI000A1FF935|nr:PAS domain S-box protein [Pseudomonas syringae]OSN24794.1 Blue-light-activated protein [Pseudomonas syringae pv. actinidiae]
MSDKDLSLMSREALENEVRQLRRTSFDQKMNKVRQDAIFDSATEFAMVVTDPNGTISAWNAGAQLVMGWTSEEMCGQDASRFFTPEDRAAGRVAYEMNVALRDGRAMDERWHIAREGVRFWASGEMIALHDEHGLHLGFVKIFRDRTAEHLAGVALLEAERRLRHAQEAGGIGLFFVDVASNRLQVTPEFSRIYGLPPAESYPADQVEALVVESDAQLVSTALRRQQGNFVGDVEYRIRRADTGELRWINRTGKMEYDQAGKPIRFSGTARDVTVHRKAINAQIASEARYRLLFDNIEDGFCIIEFVDGPQGPLSDYNHVEANPGYERQTGIAGIVGQTIRGLAPNEADGWVELYGEVLRTGKPARFERYFAAADRVIEVSATRVDSVAKPQVSILFRDITARKRAELLAAENIERVQLALEAGAIIGTWFWDIEADAFIVDESFTAAMGLDRELAQEKLTLTRVAEFVHPDDKPGLMAAIDEAIQRGGHYMHQYRTRRADGCYYWMEANGRVNHTADGMAKTFPGVLIDVDARVSVEAERDRAIAALRILNETLEQRIEERSAELMRSEEQLRQSQKMEAVGQLTGGLAHDFNNLLAGIIGSLEMIGVRLGQGRVKDIDKYIGAALGAAKRAASLTHRLLAFSRRQTLDPKTTDMNALVEGMLELIQRTVGPSIAIKVVGASDLGLARVDPSQLENALLNLCINARDAMPMGGKIVIETANRWIDKDAGSRQDIPEGQYLQLSVSDTGSGMSAELIQKAFDPFFTTKPIGQGTGLGLSMIYGFAKQSNGQVRIHSVVGEGTTVSIYLPRHQGTVELNDLASTIDLGLLAQMGETVLVVEDEPTVRLLVTDVLEDLGYIAVEAADSAGGLRVLQSNARIDLLISDVGLPGGLNGRQMADAARVARPDLKVLFITGYAENALLEQNQLEPGMSVMTKPFAVDTLVARIKELLAR